MLPLTTPPQSICLVRLSALGDVTHAIPVLRAIQHNWPQTRVTWICAALEYKLLSCLDGVRFIVLDKRSGWRAYRNLKQELGGEKFDVMLQMQTSARANVTGACVKADIKLGWDRYRAWDLHRLFVTHSIPDVQEPVWNFPIGEDARAFADSMLPADNRILVISPCSSHPHRNWRSDRYAAVADHAIEQHGMSVVLSGGPSGLERSTGEAIEQAMANRVTNLIGKDTLPQLAAVLQRADIVLSPDAGPVHLANALGTRVIGLHACTWSRRSGPYNSLELCVDKFTEAAQKFRGKSPEELRWGTRIEAEGVMDLVETDAVIERLDFAIARTGD